MNEKVRAQHVLMALEKRHRGKDAFFAEVKNGPTQLGSHLRLDALAVAKSWTHPCLTGYEIKVSRQDFLRDEKWTKYLELCNRFYFVCPKGLITLDDLPKEVGLIWYNHETGGLTTKRKPVYRQISDPVEMLYYLIFTRINHQPHPFYSNTRQMLEEWIADKADRRTLGYHIRNKMVETIKEQDKRIRELELQASTLENTKKSHERLIQTLRELGIDTNSWRWQDKLTDQLKRGLPAAIPEAIQTILHQAHRIEKLLNDNQAS